METANEPKMGVTLYPAAYDTVEMITEDGKEVIQQDFSDAQLFVHSIQELEKHRAEQQKKSKKRRIAATGKTEPVEQEKENNRDASPPEEDQQVAIKKEKEEPDVVEPNGSSEQVEDEDVEMKEAPEGDAEVTTDATGKEASEETEGPGEEEEEQEVIDPRVHYRPVVAELQAAAAELHTLINSIDLIRRREFMEEMYCMRENTAPKKEDLEYLVESKSTQIKEASRILMTGVETLTETVEKESVFFQGISSLINRWKICAPIHGNIPKPFRAGEPLAVDCSYVSAGSSYLPPTRSIADLAFAELGRTDKGLVRVKVPEEYLPRTIEVELRCVDSNKIGRYTSPPPVLKNMSRSRLEELANSPEDLALLDERNVSILRAVQFSVFCEEIFHIVMNEALRNDSSWTETAFTIGNYASNVPREVNGKRLKTPEEQSALTENAISVLHVLDDEVKLRINKNYELSIKLIDTSSTASSPEKFRGDEDTKENDGENVEMVDVNATAKVSKGTSSSIEATSSGCVVGNEESFLVETARFTLLLLQQEIRRRHGRKEIERGLLYTPQEIAAVGGNVVSKTTGSSVDTNKKDDAMVGTLRTVLDIVGHCLLKHEVTNYLDDLSASLAAQSSNHGVHLGRILDDSLNQPICDVSRGIYVSPRWKTCPYDSTLSAFDLSIGKCFTTEVLISGARIRFEDGPASLREVSSLTGLQEFVEKTVCSTVASALHRDAAAVGVKQVSMELDRASLRIYAAGEWDGSCLGEGRVPDSRVVGSIYLEPFFESRMSVSISCMVQALDAPALQSLGSTIKTNKGDVLSVEWRRIPGWTDASKLAWLLLTTKVLPPSLRESLEKKPSTSNSP